jgi:hypothetical protein
MNGSLALLVLACAQTPASEPSSARFAARYDFTGLEFAAEPDSTLRLGAVELRRGARSIALHSATPREEGAFTLFERAPGVLERFERSEAGIEHSLVIDGPLGGDGDLVVRVEVGGTNAELGERLADGTHTFGAISYGRLFGIDANGERTDGDVRLVPGGLELVIDDAWLDAAAWPITLDPVIGTAAIVTTPTPLSTLTDEGQSDDDPDAAYDVTTGHYLLAFTRSSRVVPLPGFPLVDFTSIRAQRLSGGGVPTGPEVLLDSQQVLLGSQGVREPRVANIARRDRFAVSWIDNTGLGDELNMRLVDADDGALSGTLNIAPEEGDIVDHDLAGESSNSVLFTSRVFAVWIEAAGNVKFARISVPASGDASLTSTHTIAANPGILDEWKEVSISRCTNSEGRMVVALVRESTLFGYRRLFVLTVDRNGSIVTPLTQISGNNDYCYGVTVDGGGSNPSRWVVAWEDSDGEVLPQFTLRAVALAGSGSALTPSTIASHGTAFTRTRPNIGWRPGMAVMAFDRPLTDDISVCMLCDTTAKIGEEKSTAFAWTDTPLIDYETSDAVVALRSSGGDTSAHEGLLLCHRTSSTFAAIENVIATRRYDAFDPNADSQIVLPGCGGVGSLIVPTPPAIGNPDFRIELTGAGATASLAILNLTAVQPIQTCGSCSFAPLDILTFAPIVGGAAEIALPVPCEPSLAGAQLYAQWIVYKPGVAPCAPVPDFGASQIYEITVN